MELAAVALLQHEPCLMMHVHVTGPPCGNASADGIGGAGDSSEGAEPMCCGWEGVFTGGQGQQSSRLEHRLERLSSSASRASRTDPKHVRPVSTQSHSALCLILISACFFICSEQS